MAEKLYWNIPNTQNISAGNVEKWYSSFIKNVYGKEHSELRDICLEIFNKKGTNDKYFGQIITPINLLGLLQYKEVSGKFYVEENKFISDNFSNPKFIEIYLDYFLTYFQYPRQNLHEDKENIKVRKPYILILTILKKLYDRNPNDAYLTRNEFCFLFDNNKKPYLNYEDINDELINMLLKDNRAFTKNKDHITFRTVSYDLALLKNSSLLTFDSSEYGLNDFEFGLSKDYDVIKKLEWLISEDIKNDILDLNSDKNTSDKIEITRWAKFLNNEEKFKKWQSNFYFSKENNELGESGNESGIESDSNEEDIFTTPFNPDDISIQTKPVILEGLLRRIRKHEINLNPAFQRKSVWDIERKSKLIESMMLNIPLPMFYVSSDKDNNWTVVDGLQRLSTIKEFILGNYNEDKDEYDEKGFKLKKLEFWTGLEGFNIHDKDFPGKPYNNIMETELSFTIINPDTPEEVKRNIFKRINTGGMPLTPQEIRHALYQGRSTILLEELVENKDFLTAVDKVDDTRMAGRELILRFLSFYIRNFENYTKDSSMDNHLSITMRIINILNNITLETVKDTFKNEKNIDINELYMSIKKVDLEKTKQDFELTMIRNKKIFGEHTFRKSFPGKRKTAINKTLFEVFSNLFLALDEDKFNQLLNNKDKFLEDYRENYLLSTNFSNMIGRDSHKVSSVKERYIKLNDLINKYC